MKECASNALVPVSSASPLIIALNAQLGITLIMGCAIIAHLSASHAMATIVLHAKPIIICMRPNAILPALPIHILSYK